MLQLTFICVSNFVFILTGPILTTFALSRLGQMLYDCKKSLGFFRGTTYIPDSSPPLPHPSGLNEDHAYDDYQYCLKIAIALLWFSGVENISLQGN